MQQLFSGEALRKKEDLIHQISSLSLSEACHSHVQPICHNTQSNYDYDFQEVVRKYDWDQRLKRYQEQEQKNPRGFTLSQLCAKHSVGTIMSSEEIHKLWCDNPNPNNKQPWQADHSWIFHSYSAPNYFWSLQQLVNFFNSIVRKELPSLVDFTIQKWFQQVLKQIQTQEANNVVDFSYRTTSSHYDNEKGTFVYLFQISKQPVEIQYRDLKIDSVYVMDIYCINRSVKIEELLLELMEGQVDHDDEEEEKRKPSISTSNKSEITTTNLKKRTK